MRERETEQESGREKENKNPVNPRIGRKAGALITFYCQFTIFSSRERINKINGKKMFSTTKLCRISEKPKNINKQQMIHEAESLDSAFPPFEPTAHSMHAPTLYWSTELLCYCAPFPEVNISETSEMLCRYEAWTHPQIRIRCDDSHTRAMSLWLCPMLPMNIMRCKHSKQ